MSEAQHHDIMEIIRAEGWPDIFARLLPGEDPCSPEGERLRGRINEILFAFAASHNGLKDPRQQFEFDEYAEIGETFLRGVKMAYAWLNLAAGALSIDPGRASTGVTARSEDIAAIERQISFLLGLKDLTEDIKGITGYTPTEKAQPPNYKPWLHEAIAELRLLWIDEDQAHRPKKDFLLFAESLVGGTFGVTPNSILESYDRHSGKRLTKKLTTREERKRLVDGKAVDAD